MAFSSVSRALRTTLSPTFRQGQASGDVNCATLQASNKCNTDLHAGHAAREVGRRVAERDVGDEFQTELPGV